VPPSNWLGSVASRCRRRGTPGQPVGDHDRGRSWRRVVYPVDNWGGAVCRV